MSRAIKKWITITDIRQGYFVINYLKFNYSYYAQGMIPLSDSLSHMQRNINAFIERMTINENEKSELIFKISRNLTTITFQSYEFKFIEDSELNCLYIWLRILSNQTVYKNISTGMLPKGSSHLERLYTIYYYIDMVEFTAKKYAIDSSSPKIYDKTSLFYDLKKDCADIYKKKIPFFSRMKKQKAQIDWMWEKYYLPKSFTPTPLIPCLHGEMAMRPKEDQAETNINLNDCLNILLPHEKELAIQAIYCSWSDIDLEKQKFYKQIRRTLEKKRFRMTKAKEGVKLVQAYISVENKKKLKDMAKLHRLNMSEMVEALIMQHPELPSYPENKQNEIIQNNETSEVHEFRSGTNATEAENFDF